MLYLNFKCNTFLVIDKIGIVINFTKNNNNLKFCAYNEYIKKKEKTILD